MSPACLIAESVDVSGLSLSWGSATTGLWSSPGDWASDMGIWSESGGELASGISYSWDDDEASSVREYSDPF